MMMSRKDEHTVVGDCEHDTRCNEATQWLGNEVVQAAEVLRIARPKQI